MKVQPPPTVEVRRTLIGFSLGKPTREGETTQQRPQDGSDAQAPPLSARRRPGWVFTCHLPPTYPSLTPRCSTAIKASAGARASLHRRPLPASHCMPPSAQQHLLPSACRDAPVSHSPPPGVPASCGTQRPPCHLPRRPPPPPAAPAPTLARLRAWHHRHSSRTCHRSTHPPAVAINRPRSTITVLLLLPSTVAVRPVARACRSRGRHLQLLSALAAQASRPWHADLPQPRQTTTHPARPPPLLAPSPAAASHRPPSRRVPPAESVEAAPDPAVGTPDLVAATPDLQPQAGDSPVLLLSSRSSSSPLSRKRRSVARA